MVTFTETSSELELHFYPGKFQFLGITCCTKAYFLYQVRIINVWMQLVLVPRAMDCLDL